MLQSFQGIFRKPKDCKERHIFLTERLGGDDGDCPDDPSSSSHLPISLGQKVPNVLYHIRSNEINHKPVLIVE